MHLMSKLHFKGKKNVLYTGKYGIQNLHIKKSEGSYNTMISIKEQE